jgi:hypothetical protein
MKLDPAFCRIRFEIRCNIIELQCHVNLLRELFQSIADDLFGIKNKVYGDTVFSYHVRGQGTGMAFNHKVARNIGLTADEIAILRRLDRPEAIQDFLDTLASNPEPDGDTCFSVRTVLHKKCCHCIEAAFVAACSLMLHGKPALLLDFVARDDDDHVVALFKQGRHWGAISKSNHIWLRWRDPIYRSPRELAMSYFHEYVNGNAKTLRSISAPFNIGVFDPAYWVTNEDNCWGITGELAAIRHTPLLSPAQVRKLRTRDSFEVKAGFLREFEA